MFTFPNHLDCLESTQLNIPHVNPYDISQQQPPGDVNLELLICFFLHAFEAQLQSCPSFEFDPVVVCTEPGFILRLVARTDSAKNLERNRDKAMAKSKENMDGMK